MHLSSGCADTHTPSAMNLLSAPAALHTSSVQDISGAGGSATKKVSADGGESVILHLRPDDHEPFFVDRLEAASNFFCEHSVGPLRLVSRLLGQTDSALSAPQTCPTED